MLHATDGLIQRCPERQPPDVPANAGSPIYRWGHGPRKEIGIRTVVIKGKPYLLVCFERVDIVDGIGAETSFALKITSVIAKRRRERQADFVHLKLWTQLQGAVTMVDFSGNWELLWTNIHCQCRQNLKNAWQNDIGTITTKHVRTPGKYP